MTLPEKYQEKVTFNDVLSRHAQDEKIAFAGDWHGNSLWANTVVRYAASQGITLIVQAGDFGIWSNNNGKRYLHRLNATCEEYGVDIAFIPGNHEDWARLEKLWSNPKNQDADGNKQPISFQGDRIWGIPRGYRWEINGVSFMGFGGAASIDFETRTKGYDWWEEELPSWDEVNAAVADGYVDVIVGHETVDADFSVDSVRQILSSNPMGWSKVALSYSAVSRARVTRLFTEVQPRLYVHGHMHAFGYTENSLNDEYSSNVLSLHMDGVARNAVVFDLDDFKAHQHVIEHPNGISLLEPPKNV